MLDDRIGLPPAQRLQSLADHKLVHHFTHLFCDAVPMRFSVISLVIIVTTASVLAWLNTRETRTVSKPYYAPMFGAVRHPPPYEMKEMAISVHRDRGWPIWHTRGSDHFAAHNAAAHLMEGGLPYEPAIPETDKTRAAIDIAIGFALLCISLIISEIVVRLLRKRALTFANNSTD